MNIIKKQIATIIFFILILSNLSFSQTVIKHPKPTDNLKSRWEWALKEAKSRKFKNGFWVGYSIQKLMGVNSYMGTFISHPQQDEKKLEEIIFGKTSQTKEKNIPDDKVIKEAATRALKRIKDPDSGEEKVLKNIAILFKFGSAASTQKIEKLKVSNLSLYVDFDDKPLIWLDKAEDNKSITLLKGIYKDARTEEVQEKIVTAVGVHEHSDLTIAFLENVLTGNDPDDVREKAAFWMGQQNTGRALKILLKAAQKDRSRDVRKKAVFGISQIETDGATDGLIFLAEKADDAEIREKAIFWLGQGEREKALKFLIKASKSDPSSDVREKAVFSISQMDSEKALDALIDLAYHAERKAVRKKAIFWLGQKASKKGVAALTDVVENDSDVEVQKRAVFALTQLPHNEGVPHLIKIAKTHPSKEVRKKAIFWLGQSDDERALDALVEIVGKK